MHAKAIASGYERYTSAFAVLELVFDRTVISTLHGDAAELVELWRQFDEEWQSLLKRLNSIIPEERMQAMALQREEGRYDESARGQMEDWIVEFKTGIAALRSVSLAWQPKFSVQKRTA
jgi:hypothetical protein